VSRIAGKKPQALQVPKRALPVPVSGLKTNDPSSRPEGLPLSEPSLHLPRQQTSSSPLSRRSVSSRPCPAAAARVPFALACFLIAPCHAPPPPIGGCSALPCFRASSTVLVPDLLVAVWQAESPNVCLSMCMPCIASPVRETPSCAAIHSPPPPPPLPLV
jgi:hypothetical protein